MRRSDREAKLEWARTLGRIAYGRVRFFQQGGLIVLDGATKEFYELSEDGLFVRMSRPLRKGDPTEMSRLCVYRDNPLGKKVLDIEWNGSGYFQILTYKPDGDWEDAVCDWHMLIPFD
jgi:hypothetical protein